MEGGDAHASNTSVSNCPRPLPTCVSSGADRHLSTILFVRSLDKLAMRSHTYTSFHEE